MEKIERELEVPTESLGVLGLGLVPLGAKGRRLDEGGGVGERERI